VVLGNASHTSTPMMLGNTSQTVVLGNRAPTPAPVVLGSKARLQQLRLPTGQLVWAQPVASEPIPGSDKAKIQFKVVGPVKETQPSQQAPGVIQSTGKTFNTFIPQAPTMKKNKGPSYRAQAPATSKSILYKPIVPRASSQVIKPARMAQPLQLLHVDKDGAPVYHHNGFQPHLGVEGGQNKLLHQNKFINSGFGTDRNMLNSIKLVPMNQVLKRPGDHEYSSLDPLEEEGVDPLEGLDPYEDEGVDPLAGDKYSNSSSSPVILLDD